jgi:hypothetical protein
MPHNQFVVKKSQWGVNKMQKGINLGGQNCTIKLGGPKLHNYETWRVKIAQLKLGGPKSHNSKTWGAKTAFKP